MKSPLQSSCLFAGATYGFEGRRFFSQQLTPSEEAFDDENQLPTPEEFDAIVEDYLNNLSPKKRDKALVDQQRYQLIQQVLKDPRNTAISTAQFRFWVKKMFQLQPGTVGLVCHDSKPVAMKEQIYSILVKAHREAQHGGRDKTSALVRRKFSWIPKELVARFVRHCPFCITRRNGGQSPAAASALSKARYAPARHSLDAAFLCTPSMHDDSDFSSTTDNGYGASPASYAYSSSATSPARRDSMSVYDSRDDDDLLNAYARSGGIHPLLTHPTAAITPTPFSTAGATSAATLLDDASPHVFYQAPSTGYLAYPPYYYPNVLGIAPCDQPAIHPHAAASSHHTAAEAAAATGILAHHQQNHHPCPPLPYADNDSHAPLL